MQIYALNVAGRAGITESVKLLSHVSEHRRDKIRRFHRKEDAVRSLASELLARRVIAEQRNIPSHQILFELNAYGKPHVKGEPSIHFNLTHSGDWVVCAIGDAALGIDVEKIIPIEVSVAERYFTKEEQDYTQEPAEERERLCRFYEIWSLKESYLKAIGAGLSVSLPSFSIEMDSEAPQIRIQGQRYGEAYYFKLYTLDKGYSCAVCSLLPINTERIIRVDAAAFFESWGLM